MAGLKLLVLTGAAILALDSARAQDGAGPSPVPQVAAAKRDIESFCQGRTTYAPRFQTLADLNRDGKPDYILDYGEAQCSQGSNGFCGSAGCTLQIVVSSPRGYVNAFNENVRSWSLKQVRGEPIVALGLHGSACGRVGAASCSRDLVWNGRTFVPGGRR